MRRHGLAFSDGLVASLEAQYRQADVAAPLLAALRERLGVPALAYAEPPEPMLGGTESWIFGFRLAGLGENGAPAGPEGSRVAEAWRAPLVLRLAREGRPPPDLACEATFLNAVADQGYPAPRALHVDSEGRALGRPWLVMERMPGTAGPAGLFARSGDSGGGTAVLLAAVPRLVTTMPRLAGEALLRLHALDPEPVLHRLDAAGIPRVRATVDRQLDELEREAAALRHRGLDALVRWLRASRPPEPERPVICHGDFHAFNLMFEPGPPPRVSGVIDWTGARIGDPMLDVGLHRVQLEISQLPVAGVPPRVVHAVQRRLARAFERAYARGRPLDEARLGWCQVLPCAVAVARMLREGGDPDREPLAELAWEHPRALRRLRERVRAITGIEPRAAAGPAPRH